MTSRAARLAGRRLWIGVAGNGERLAPDVRAHLEAIRPGGLVLFRRNIASAPQVASWIRDARDLLGPDLRIAVDQEHGLVTRFDRELAVFPGAMALGAAGMREPSLGEHLARECGEAAGAQLAELGVDVNLAPVCDLAVRGDNPGLGVRSFSAHAALAGRLAAAWTRGQRSAGVASTLKHFPGLGAATLDTHLDLPYAEVRDLDAQLEPFAAGIAAGAECVMSTHAAFPALDADAPATFSAPILRGLLRERLGFRGVLVTDDLEMGAV
ncbi:MAG TPA: glycoside hydrolase family 3 N-terminal domain-containing protein, partial [Planctomycetota bacterium]|nr:glycoside hydrolase family 3 N-terminal domain-containing protein [Planctomycetota bacterium]